MTTTHTAPHMIDEGQGPIVVMLHGAPDHKETWRAVIERLKADHRCIAIDLPGMGHFGEVPQGYDFSIKAQLDYFEAWRSAYLGEQPFVLLAHDIGAIMGAAWAAHYPDKVEHIIISNTVLSRGHRWVGITKVWASPILGPLFMKTLIGPAFELVFGRDFPGVSRDQVRSMYRGLTPTARKNLLSFYRELTRPDYFDDAAEQLNALSHRVPTTVVWGMADKLIPTSYAQTLGGALIPLEGCDHWVPLERADKLEEVIRAITQTQPPQQASPSPAMRPA